MAQLLAGGIIVFGLVIIAFAIFLVRRENNVQPIAVATLKTEEHVATTTTPEVTLASAPTSQPIEANVVQAKVAREEIISSLPSSKVNNAILVLHEDTSLPIWWHEQFDSLITQVQELREHAKDVERQIVILDEIATRAAELESLQRKHAALPEGKISLFPMKVHRQPTDVSYVTDKRPVVRKYTIKAM